VNCASYSYPAFSPNQAFFFDSKRPSIHFNCGKTPLPYHIRARIQQHSHREKAADRKECRYGAVAEGLDF
jgi:hypothetical protein